MYVCLCKGLTENDVARTARACLHDGAPSPDAFLDALQLDCETACGYCAAETETFLSIAEWEWTTAIESTHHSLAKQDHQDSCLDRVS